MLTRIDATRIWGAGETHRGKVRATNQDLLIIEPDLGLYAVLDGMGGTNGGELAARLAREAIIGFIRHHAGREQFTSAELLEFAIDAGASAVFTAGERSAEYQGMGTTVVACLAVAPSRVVIGHAGDSRAYLLRDGYLRALTHDHTIVQTFLDEGSMTSEQAERSPIKHILTRNLGATNGVKADILEQPIYLGDRVLLCSDGLHGGASSDAIQRALGSTADPGHVAHQLIELALGGEALDNISAVVIEIERVP